MFEAADTDIGDGQPRAGEILHNPHDQFARFDHVEADRDCAEFGAGHAAAGEVIENPRQLADDDANILTTRRRFDTDKFFHGQGIADIVDQRRSVVEPVSVGDDLCPSCLLAALVEAAMEITDLDVAVEHLFAVEFEIEFDRAMGRRMGWSHLQLHRLQWEILVFRFHAVTAGLNFAAQGFF